MSELTILFPIPDGCRNADDMGMPEPIHRSRAEYAGWLADKIPAYGDYAREAAFVLVRQAEEIELLRSILKEGADGFGKLLIQTSDDNAVRDWQKRAKALLMPNVKLRGAL